MNMQHPGIRMFTPPAVSFFEVFKFWLKLGLISFGGSAGQIAMQRRTGCATFRLIGVSAPRHQARQGLKTVSRPTAANLIGLSMDTTQALSFSLSVAQLAASWRGADAPCIVDVRKNDAFAASSYLLPGALRRDPLQVNQWAAELPQAHSVLVYCVNGHEVSQNTTAALRQRGIKALFLHGGIEAWREQGHPLADKPVGGSTRWVTRERPRIDRIACPWLIRRFVDADAQFLYVPPDQVAAVAAREVAMPYDVAPHLASTRFTHDGEFCSFDAFVKYYQLAQDAALVRLAQIVRGADTDRLDLAPQCAGLVAVSLGMARTHADDSAMLEIMMPVYDALYAWCRDAVVGQDEKHTWKTA